MSAIKYNTEEKSEALEKLKEEVKYNISSRAN